MSFSHHLFFCLNQRSNGEDCCDPEGIWYTLIDQDDVEEIIQSHLIAGRPVKRLELS